IIQAGQLAPSPIAVQLTTAGGQPAIGAQVAFSVASSCGSFDGQTFVVIPSSSTGLVSAPTFRGASAGSRCSIDVAVSGTSLQVSIPIVVYAPGDIRATVSPTSVTIHVNESFTLTYDVTAFGAPLPGVTIYFICFVTTPGVQVGTAPNNIVTGSAGRGV